MKINVVETGRGVLLIGETRNIEEAITIAKEYRKTQRRKCYTSIFFSKRKRTV